MLEDLATMPPLQRFLAVLFMLAWAGGLLSWLVTVFYMIRLPRHAKEGRLRGWFRTNPIVLVFFSDRLTPEGLTVRRRLLISAGCFIAFCALGALSGLAAKALAQA